MCLSECVKIDVRRPLLNEPKRLCQVAASSRKHPVIQPSVRNKLQSTQILPFRHGQLHSFVGNCWGPAVWVRSRAAPTRVDPPPVISWLISHLTPCRGPLLVRDRQLALKITQIGTQCRDHDLQLCQELGPELFRA